MVEREKVKVKAKAKAKGGDYASGIPTPVLIGLVLVNKFWPLRRLYG